MISLIVLLIACGSDVEPIPDAWTRASVACEEPVPWFDDDHTIEVALLWRRPAEECEAVLRDDFGIEDGDVGLSAAWSLVLWPGDPLAYDDAAYRIDSIVVDSVDRDGWASFDDGVTTIGAPDKVVGILGASVLVHEGAHAWAPGHVRCPLTGEHDCDDDWNGAIGTQASWLDGVIALADADAHSRGGTVEPLRSFRDGLDTRILNR